jgi:hypothetical protein
MLFTYGIMFADMDPEHREGMERLQSLAADEDFHAGDMSEAPSMVNMGGILDGSERIELSHAGGEFGSLEQDLEEDSGDDNPPAKARYAGFASRIFHLLTEM